MPLTELMSQIQEFSKIDKLRLMQFLATELVKEEDPVWSPYDASEAANVVMNWYKLNKTIETTISDR
ncbi:hypothetical protein H6F67_11765 [Microcoleus sp. FACHB-1515]|uniref:hypothetical protein n=1 Tax=Cyanophyceae TaxID=3028117 RepID=UPI00168329A8|nr:hypothetical protein [Microcoleus sp. FACHB-1515]MBD2090530.1 hypothetical protein [Microcoleus sp. FACHB-1515]